LYYGENQTYPLAANWQNDLITGGFTRAMPKSPIDHADYRYSTDTGRSVFVLWDGPDKILPGGCHRLRCLHGHRRPAAWCGLCPHPLAPARSKGWGWRARLKLESGET